MSLIELAQVTRTVQLPDGSDLRILRGVDLSVDPGDHISIVGRSGTGKSTMLNIIGLLDLPTDGTYTINDIDVTRLGEGKRSALRGSTFGFVFQQFNIFNARTAVENVEVPLLYATGQAFWRRRTLAASMLDRVGLGDRLNSYPSQMSGGEQQRIAIARALAAQPAVIFADEPTGALDQTTGHEIMSILMRTARQTGAAVVVVTHDSNVAAFCDATVTMRDGRLSSPQQSQPIAGGAR